MCGKLQLVEVKLLQVLQVEDDVRQQVWRSGCARRGWHTGWVACQLTTKGRQRPEGSRLQRLPVGPHTPAWSHQPAVHISLPIVISSKSSAGLLALPGFYAWRPGGNCDRCRHLSRLLLTFVLGLRDSRHRLCPEGSRVEACRFTWKGNLLEASLRGFEEPDCSEVL